MQALFILEDTQCNIRKKEKIFTIISGGPKTESLELNIVEEHISSNLGSSLETQIKVR